MQSPQSLGLRGATRAGCLHSTASCPSRSRSDLPQGYAQTREHQLIASEGTTTLGSQASVGAEVCKDMLCPVQGTLDPNAPGNSPLVFSQGAWVLSSPTKGCPCPRPSSPSSSPEALLEAMNIWMPPNMLDQECHLVATELIKVA